MGSRLKLSHFKGTRANLLVNLATRSKEDTIQDEDFLMPPDVFESNAYDPTLPTSLNEADVTMCCVGQLLNSASHSQNNELTIQPIQSPIESFQPYTTAVESPMLFEELQVMQTSEMCSLQSQTDGAEQHSHSSAHIQTNEQLQTNNNIRKERLVLNEVTGEFMSGLVNLGHVVDNDSGNGMYLNEKTGEFLTNDTDETEEDTELNMCGDEDVSKNRKLNKKKRVLGKEYRGRKRVIVDGSKAKYEHMQKPMKIMREKPCSHSATSYSDRSMLCGLISEDKRKAIFKYFWRLETWDAKKAYLKNLVQLRPIIKRRKSVGDHSHRKLAYEYYLPDDENTLRKVCKLFLLSTLDINADTLIEWIKRLQDSTTTSTTTAEDLKSKHQKRQNNSEKNIRQPVKEAAIREWLNLLNKMPSHYCRASSTRVYVEDTFESKSHMFREYESWCQKNGKRSAGRKYFNAILEDEKISIFKPRKDQCDTCTGHKEGSITEEQYALHIAKKNEAYKAHNDATGMSSSEVLVMTIDVQSVLLSPKMLVSVQYYKQKLQVHNQSIYVNNNKDVHLYVWHEGDGGVTSNEFTTCVISFIKSQIQEGNFKKIIMVTDGCSYQNRNKILASALIKLSKQTSVDIEQLFLEKGHTMMPVDSVHSTLERKFRPPIYAPSDYISRMREARPKQPYYVNQVDYTFFKKYDDDVCLDSLRPGKKTGDPTVNDLRGLLYKDGEVYYKLRHPDDWTILPQRVRHFETTSTPEQLYNEPRQIEKSKFESLQSLKPFMHRDYHAFYDSLRYRD